MSRATRRVNYPRLTRVIWIAGLAVGIGIGTAAAVGVIGYAPLLWR